MKELLIELINNYVGKLAYIVALLNEKSKTIKGFQITDPIGFLDSENSILYTFHGATGINIKGNTLFDFDVVNQRCDGLNPFILSEYIRKNEMIYQKYLTLINIDLMLHLLEELTIEGLFEKKKSYNDNVFYFLKDTSPLIIHTFGLTYEQTVDWFKNGIRPNIQ